ncbi:MULTISPECIES: hypothetical protein [unclassified Streptomyces]|uniref:hypothetical protein n=1 Tax=unclassified Streptomyces TaxID=2593676 RepID=UPI002DDA5511|nr:MULTISPECIES: hypothetical protein [unclassified Streptomyces]WSA94025.1 hypothetical protein OIE63_22425 [Streptomyces sp. NBC_01795]WSB78450.1 hypothetical protein OHB04_23555 [Streptomyces sp. NBC_01775]WSS13348.1 hypothetical protein OG533_16685 [Streptomyces sp. NBC_01186]WSS42137.1 hypothetical protein OG220_17245 [Streptomyces sp. NBC_01187]
MKSWRSRIGVGLAIGAAAVAIPLTTATPASADPPPGAAWQPVGAENYSSKAECEATELPYAKQSGFNEVWCDDDKSPMSIYYR